MPIDSKIIKQCKRQNPDAQKKVYDTYSPVLTAICRRYLGFTQEAEDVLQDAFVTIFTKIKQYKGSGSFEGWIKRITVNTALMHLRKRKLMYNTDDLHLREETEPEKELNVKDKRSVIEHAQFSASEMLEHISQLPDGFRAVFNLYVVEGYKHKEIAEMLDISEGTSKSQLLRARKRFQEILYKKAQEKVKLKLKIK